MTAEPIHPRPDPFLDEVRRLKEEAVAGRDIRELAIHLKKLEEKYSDRLVQPPDRSSTSAA